MANGQVPWRGNPKRLVPAQKMKAPTRNTILPAPTLNSNVLRGWVIGWVIVYQNQLYDEVDVLLGPGSFLHPDGAFAYNKSGGFWAARKACTWALVTHSDVPDETRAVCLLLT